MSNFRGSRSRTLVIEAEDDTSSVVSLVGPSRGVAIFSPEELSGSVIVEVSHNGTDFVELYSGGERIQVPANACVIIDYSAWQALRLVSTASEYAEREFVVQRISSA